MQIKSRSAAPAAPAGVALAMLVALSCGSPRPRQPSAETIAEQRFPVLPQSGTLGPDGFITGRPSADLDNGELTIWWRDAANRIDLAVRSGGAVILHIDANQNGNTDPGIDLSYGAFPSGGLCAEYFEVNRGAADCGQAPTHATVAVKEDGDGHRWAWSLPKAELASSSGDALIVFQTYHERSQQSHFYPATPFAKAYRLKFPAAVDDSAVSVSPSSSHVAEMLTVSPQGAPQPSQRASQITPARAELPPPAALPISRAASEDNSGKTGGVAAVRVAPQWLLQLFAQGQSIAGARIPLDSDRLKSVGFVVNYTGSSPPPVLPVQVEWFLNDQPDGLIRYEPGDNSYTSPRAYRNKIEVGHYRVRLVVDSSLRQTIEFDVVKGGG